VWVIVIEFTFYFLCYNNTNGVGLMKTSKKTLKYLLIAVLGAMIIYIFAIIFKIRIDKTPEIYTQKEVKSEIADKYTELKKYAEIKEAVPGLEEGIIPQGICYSSTHNVILITGYHKGKAPSVIFILDATTNKLIKSITLTYENKTFQGHVGGITTDEETVWILDDKTLYHFNLKELIQTSDMNSIEVKKIKELPIKTDFCTYYEGTLWIGEYYYSFLYSTDKSHHLSINNETNKALLFGYENNDYQYPTKIISIPDKVQGLLFTKDKIIISQSFFRFESSNLLIYENILKQEASTVYKLDNKEIPLYFLSSKQLLKMIEMPPMEESITLIDDKIYLIFESASIYYKFLLKYKTDGIVIINGDIMN